VADVRLVLRNLAFYVCPPAGFDTSMVIGKLILSPFSTAADPARDACWAAGDQQ
jgi:hypothetical protein